MEDFVRAVQPPAPRRLAGFSAGGGFVLRLAGSARQDLFDAYLLLAPFLGQQACTYRPDSGGWVSVGLPRIVALTALNSLGLKALNGLSVIAFALRPEVQAQLTPRYAYGLAMNFRPHADYRADMAAARRPMAVVVGQDDDQFIASRFADAFKAAARPVPVTLVQGTGHLDLTLRSPGIQAAIADIEALDRARG